MRYPINKDLKIRLIKALDKGIFDTEDFKEIFPKINQKDAIKNIRKAFDLDNLTNPIEHDNR